MSGIRQLLSKNGLSGPYRRKITNHRPALPVVIQLFSLPAAACGAKSMSTEPSAFLMVFSLYESRLTTGASRMKPAVSQSYTVADQYCLAGTFGGTWSRYVFPPTSGRLSRSLSVEI